MLDLQEAHSRIPRVLMVVSEDSSASCQWRVKWPCQALTQRGFVADWVLDSQFEQVWPMLDKGRYNLVVMSRLNWSSDAERAAWTALMAKYGLTWVYGVDDYAWGAESTDPERLIESVAVRGHDALERDRLNRIEDAQQANAVLVSTPVLADLARQITDKPVVCIPNMMPMNRLTPSNRQKAEGSTTIGWAGSYRPRQDLEGLALAWSDIAEKFPQVAFVILGDPAPVLSEAVPADRLLWANWLPFDQYATLLREIDVLCCYAPQQSEFCRAKSPIRWIEGTTAGCACVVSEAVYGQVVDNGETGLVATTRREWVGAISQSLAQPELRQKLIANASTDVRLRFDLDRNWSAWLDGLNKLRGVA